MPVYYLIIFINNINEITNLNSKEEIKIIKDMKKYLKIIKSTLILVINFYELEVLKEVILKKNNIHLKKFIKLK